MYLKENDRRRNVNAKQNKKNILPKLVSIRQISRLSQQCEQGGDMYGLNRVIETRVELEVGK